ncbi:hypothetical protein BH09ACT4_BH09ACT4_03770 [soil metagenome]
MDIFSSHHIDAILASERELALQAERVRVANARSNRPARRTLGELLLHRTPLLPVTTGSIVRPITGSIGVTAR